MYGARIDVPVREFAHIFLRCPDVALRDIEDIVLTIRRLDHAVEAGDWAATPCLWRRLRFLTAPLEESWRSVSAAEVEELQIYERHEKDLRQGKGVIEGRLSRILYLKSADINIYRRSLACRAGQKLCPDVYKALRATDTFRELCDDVADVEEDLVRPNFNFLVLAQRLSVDPVSVVCAEFDALLGVALATLRRLCAGGALDAESCAVLEAAMADEEERFRALIPEKLGWLALAGGGRTVASVGAA
ncbi:MAG TPA: hypothetical protein VM238_02620 [Phycisphaerae bacterium]|nr:hypothetical protein [Phycisphaerae bacterium]